MNENLERFKEEIEQETSESKERLQKILDKLEVIEEKIIEPNWDETYSKIECENYSYAIRTRRSNVGAWKSLEVEVADHHWKKIPKKVGKLGNSGHVHGDFNTGYAYINRKELIRVAQDSQGLVENFKDMLEKESWREEEALEQIEEAING